MSREDIDQGSLENMKALAKSGAPDFEKVLPGLKDWELTALHQVMTDVITQIEAERERRKRPLRTA